MDTIVTIFDNIQKRTDDFVKSPVLAGQNLAMAIAAMRDGVKSSAWESYMSQFARKADGSLDTDHLARLTGTDGTLGDPILDRKRGYLIGNAMCGMSTAENFAFGIESIDHGIRGHKCSLSGPTCEIKKPTPPSKRGSAKKAAKKKR